MPCPSYNSIFQTFPPSSLLTTMEEDWNMLAADCIVISCCCQCLVLQVIILLLLKLPYKLVQKTRELAKRKLRQRKRHKMKMEDRELNLYTTEFVANYIHGHSARYSSTEMVLNDAGHDCKCCMEDVENVFEELFRKGEFGFGSFWGREGPWTLPTTVDKNETVRYEIIETIGSLSYSSKS